MGEVLAEIASDPHRIILGSGDAYRVETPIREADPIDRRPNFLVIRPVGQGEADYIENIVLGGTTYIVHYEKTLSRIT
jgi:hypothetical protein